MSSLGLRWQSKNQITIPWTQQCSNQINTVGNARNKTSLNEWDNEDIKNDQMNKIHISGQNGRSLYYCRTVKIRSPKFAVPALGSWFVSFVLGVWKGFLPFANAAAVHKGSFCKFGFAKVRLRQCAGPIVYRPLPSCPQYCHIALYIYDEQHLSYLIITYPWFTILLSIFVPRFAAEELRRDREIVLTAVRRSGVCLESLGATAKGSICFVLVGK